MIERVINDKSFNELLSAVNYLSDTNQMARK